MVFKVNDKVSLQNDEDGGYVIKVDGETITWKNTMGQVKENSQDELKAATGMAAFFRSEAPDLIEIAENTAAFALVQGVTRNKILAMPTMTFLVENALYEILLKTYAGEYTIVTPLTAKYPLTQDQYDSWFPSMPQLMNAANKAWAMTLIDTVNRLVRRQPQLNRERLMYIVKTFLAMEIGNYGHNLWATRTRSTYKPQ